MTSGSSTRTLSCKLKFGRESWKRCWMSALILSWHVTHLHRLSYTHTHTHTHTDPPPLPPPPFPTHSHFHLSFSWQHWRHYPTAARVREPANSWGRKRGTNKLASKQTANKQNARVNSYLTNVVSGRLCELKVRACGIALKFRGPSL